MKLSPLVYRRPVHQRTIIAYPSPLAAQEGRMREKIWSKGFPKKQLLNHIPLMRADVVEIDRPIAWKCEWPLVKHQRR